MLMPILTGRIPAMATHSTETAAALPEKPTAQQPGAQPTVSGRQSQTFLKILETLNRHLLGNEVLPKETLVRLMDTLARILKFPPLPQESTLDFGKRLAGYLESMTPAARASLEKQLTQRNLALPVRLLVEALKNPLGLEASRLQSVLQTGSGRSGAEHIAGSSSILSPSKPISSQLAPPLPGPVPQQAQGVPTALAAMAAAEDAGFLQAVLKKAFGDIEEPISRSIAIDENSPEVETVAPERPQNSARAQAQAGTKAIVTGGAAQRQPAGSTNALPTLRAAVAFLAGDPDALSLVAAITGAATEGHAETIAAEDTNVPALPIGETAAEDHATEASVQMAPDMPFIEEVFAGSIAADAMPEVFPEELGPYFESLPEIDNPLPTAASYETVDLTEAFADAAPGKADWTIAHVEEQPAKILADTLKALVQASLPLPEGAARVASSEGLPLEVMLDAALVERDGTTERMAAHMETVEIALLDVPEEGVTEHRRSWAMLAAAAEQTPEPQTQRPVDLTLVLREAIPFAMIPYLPAKANGLRTTKAEDDEPANASEDEQAGEEQSEDGKDEQRSDRREHSDQDRQSVSPPAEDDDAADAYDLYRRLGGLV